MQRGYLFFFLVTEVFLDALAPEWLSMCAANDRLCSSLLSFLLEEFVRERLVRVLSLDPTVSVQFYLVGTSIVSVIASWMPKVFSYSLSIIEAPTTF